MAGPKLPSSLPTSARQLVDVLSRPGPYRVLRGDLGLVGIPGVIFTPTEGLGLPAVAFGHDWMQHPDRYLSLLRHLASWGIVAAAPSSQCGPLPSHTRFSADLRTALDVCVGVRLGDGAISVDRQRLALAGHGTGGGCAVLAATGRAEDESVAAVVTLALAETWPSAIDAARTVTAPALHLAAGKDQVSPPAAGAEPVAETWGGPVTLRRLPKANHLGFLDGWMWFDALLAGGPQASTARLTRSLMTGFLLHQLVGEHRCAQLTTGRVKGTTVELSR
ncbi:MAG: alpha/beta hydrolase [Pseudonocardia sp.]|nr:alpha/beta hydrolase [Pseudonocardia sp.]